MISIIIASVHKDLLAKVSANIAETIGVVFELISFDNANGKTGLCELYNQGATQAKFDLLCFMHEDLEIKTNNWGQIVMKTFENQANLGVLGVAGCAYKTYAPSGWDVEANESKVRHLNYIQSSKHTVADGKLICSNPSHSKIANVAAVDGMWFCTTKSVIEKYPFDSSLLKGFHGYDLDFCLGVGQQFEVAVTFEILMAHFSEGNFSKDWLLESLKIHNKWQQKLPVNLQHIVKLEATIYEKRAYKRLVLNLFKAGFSAKEVKTKLKAHYDFKNLGWTLYLKLLFYVFVFGLKSRKST